MEGEEEFLHVGRICGLFGVAGWVKVFSFTDPRENILRYDPWLLGVDARPFAPRAGRVQGKGLIARLEGIADRTAAESLLNAPIAIRRAQLPPLAADDYYWSDLIGLRVVNAQGVALGRVERLIETGAHDVLAVRGDRERLIPWVPGRFVMRVDLAAGALTVDWSPDD